MTPPRAQPPAAAADPQSVRPQLIPGGEPASGEIPATPGEEAELSQVVNKSLRFIHGRESRDQTLQMLHDPSQSVAEVVGRAAYRILSTVSDQKQAGTREPVAEDILEEAAGYVVPELMQVGVAAGIFPFDAPDDSQEEVGQGGTEFDQQVRMAMLEATKAYGEAQLRGPDGERRTAEAQDEWARGVAQEVESGTADPEFMQMAQSQLAPAGASAGAPQEAG